MLGDAVEKLVAGRWIAGRETRDAIETAKRFNRRRVSAIFNYLGEAYREKAEAEHAVSVYSRLINEIARQRIDAALSIKATQLGLLIGRGYARRSYARIANLARRRHVFVWLDMEEERYVDDVLQLYRSQMGKGGVGICIQSYLRRSEGDARRLAKAGAVIRLVKGAYSESKRVAYGTREQVTESYVRIMSYLFRNSEEFTIATHDLAVVREALLLNRSYRKKVTYAMLNGIRNKYLLQLAQLGNRTAVYIPFGERWLEYGLRRMREEGHLTLLLKSLFENQGI